MATPEEQLQQLVAQVAALTAAQGDQHAALQQMRAERDQLKGLLDEGASRQQEMQQALMQTQQALIEQQRATTAAVSAAGSSASKTVKHLGVLKAVRQPQSLKDRDGWEKFGFQVETYLALLDSEYPVSLEAARKSVDPMVVADMTDDCADRGRKLFAMLNSWTQEMPIAVKIARGIRDQNGFEFWRLLHRELAPENHSKSLIWRRTLLSPKFPSKENEFSAALQEWEADLDKYEAEYGSSKAISDEDKRAVVITEAPSALKQHLSMHLASLKTYLDVRDVVVSYLQAKRVWTPNAMYAGSAARKDPNAMDIGKIGGKGGKGKKGDNKGKNDKGKGGKDHHGKGKGKPSQDGKGKNDKERCAICWKTSHSTDKCWYNSKGHEKGNGKSQKQVSNVNEGGEADSVLSAGPSASQVGGSVITMPSSVSTTPSPKKSVRKIWEHRLLVIREHTKEVSHDAILAQVSTTSQQAILAENEPPGAILALQDKPGWHDLDTDAKVFVVRGKEKQKRSYVTPGAQSTLSGQHGS